MMNQSNGSKQKLTLIATEAGIERAKKALIRLGFESKTSFANSIYMNRAVVYKFFNCKPIQLDSFKRICQQLGGLRWQEIAGISEKKLSERVRGDISNNEREIGGRIQRQVTVIDPQTKTKKVIISLQGDIESVTNLKILQSILRENSGNTIEIQDVQPGSIKISLEGSREDIDKLITAINSQELKQLDTFIIEDIIEIEEEILKAENNNKWQLIQRIWNTKVKKLNFKNIDLSDVNLRSPYLGGADLGNADLSDVNLRSAYLGGADLSNADLSDADLHRVNLRSSNLSGANLRGTKLSGANLRSTNLNNAKMSDADLSGACLNSAYCNCAELKDSKLVRANLENTDLSFVNLFKADMSGANLKNAILRSANLTDANLSGADVSNARFGDNQGISDNLKQDLIARGAIFEDSPEDRSRVFTTF